MQEMEGKGSKGIDTMLILYNEFISFGLHKQLLKKAVLHRKINFEEFYYMRAKRYVSIPNNQDIHVF